MNKIISVAKWEFLEKIKTRAFLISMIVTPVIIIAFAIMPTLLENHETDVTKLVGVVDKSETYFSGLQEKLKEEKLPGDLPRYVLVNLTPDSQATNNGNEDISKILR